MSTAPERLAARLRARDAREVPPVRYPTCREQGFDRRQWCDTCLVTDVWMFQPSSDGTASRTAFSPFDPFAGRRR